MLRVLKPKRRLAFAVWHFAERNPFHYVLMDVVDRYVQPEPVAPGAPDAFLFAAQGKLMNVLKEAGAVDEQERILEFRVEVPLSADNYWTFRSEMSVKLRSKLARLSAEQLTSLRSEVIEAVGPYSMENGISFPAEVVIVSASKT